MCRTQALGGQMNGVGGAICHLASLVVGLLSLLLCPSGCCHIATVFEEAFYQIEEGHPPNQKAWLLLLEWEQGLNRSERSQTN